MRIVVMYPGTFGHTSKKHTCLPVFVYLVSGPLIIFTEAEVDTKTAWRATSSGVPFVLVNFAVSYEGVKNIILPYSPGSYF